jgi:hypothetical protein
MSLDWIIFCVVDCNNPHFEMDCNPQSGKRTMIASRNQLRNHWIVELFQSTIQFITRLRTHMLFSTSRALSYKQNPKTHVQRFFLKRPYFIFLQRFNDHKQRNESSQHSLERLREIRIYFSLAAQMGVSAVEFIHYYTLSDGEKVIQDHKIANLATV